MSEAKSGRSALLVMYEPILARAYQRTIKEKEGITSVKIVDTLEDARTAIGEAYDIDNPFDVVITDDTRVNGVEVSRAAQACGVKNIVVVTGGDPSFSERKGQYEAAGAKILPSSANSADIRSAVREKISGAQDVSSEGV